MPADDEATATPWLERAGRQIDAGDWAGALATSEDAVARRPAIAGAWNLRGAVLAATGRSDEAIAALDRAAALDPGDPEPLFNLLRLHPTRRDWAAVQRVAARLLALRPNAADVHRMLAQAAAGLGMRRSAEARLRLAVRLEPGYVPAWLDLIDLLASADAAGAAEAADAALAVNPQDAGLATRKRDIDAAAALQTALQISPADPALVARRLDLAMQRLAGWQAAGWSPLRSEGRELQAAHDVVLAALDAGLSPTTLPSAASTVLARLMAWDALDRVRPVASDDGPTDPRDLMMKLSRIEPSREARLDLLRQHRRWGEEVEARTRRLPLPILMRRGGSRIRLGLLSSDLRDHAVGAFAWPLFEHRDEERFEIFVYSSFQGATDSGEQAFAAHSTAYRRLPADPVEAAKVVAGDGLDILFELGGLTGANRPALLAQRLAPLQVSWLGYPHSMGLSTIDHLLLDPYLSPTSTDLLNEIPLLMPSSWITLGGRAFRDEPRPAPAPPVVRNGFVTFGSANASYKYSRACLDAWARVLAAVPSSHFLFVRPEADAPSFRKRVTDAFAVHGVAADRVGFEAVRGGHLPFYDRIDISLDTLPLTGGTTTCESLWMGAPVVTLVGEAIFERLSYSILTNVGLSDLAATTLDGYVEIAAKLAADPVRLTALRVGLRDRIKTSPLGQDEQFVRDFYDLVERAVESRRTG